MNADDLEPVRERDLLAYVDGRLAAERRRAVDRHLAARLEERARIEAWLQQNEALRQRLGGIATEPVPPALRAVLDRPPALVVARRQRAVRVMAAAALSLAVGLSGGLGWWLGQRDGEHARVRAFVGALATLPTPPDPSGAPVTTAGVEEPAPLDWLERRIAMDLRAPDLGEAGWQLRRRALVDIDGRPAVRLSYADAEGREVALYLRQRWSATRGEPAIETTDDGTVPAAYWYDGPLVWALVGDLAATELEALGRAAHGSMRLRPVPEGPAMRPVAPLDDPLAPPRAGTGGDTADSRLLEVGEGRRAIE